MHHSRIAERAWFNTVSSPQCVKRAWRAEMIKFIKTNVRGAPMGEDIHSCKYTDDEVARARHLYDQGMTLTAIAAELGSCHQTIHDWVTHRRRNPPVRVIAKRIRSESFVTDHQSSQKHVSYQLVILDLIN